MIFLQNGAKKDFENVLQCKLKEIQRLYKTILSNPRFFCTYNVFTQPGESLSQGFQTDGGEENQEFQTKTRKKELFPVASQPQTPAR
jgi:hypothetical protein